MSFLNLIDWYIFRAAILGFWQGLNPYLVGADHLRVYNPVWTLILLSPIAFLPEPWDMVAFWAAAYLVMTAVAWKLQFKWWQTAFLLTSPWLFQSLWIGNIDWLPWIGLLIPNTSIALLFLVIKPQETACAILVLIVREIRPELSQRNWKGAVIKLMRVGAPLTALLAIQVALYGIVIPTPSLFSNWSLFPYSVPVGLLFLVLALRKDNVRLGAMATPFLTPYLTPGSYIATAIAFPAISWTIGWAVMILKAIR